MAKELNLNLFKKIEKSKKYRNMYLLTEMAEHRSWYDFTKEIIESLK